MTTRTQQLADAFMHVAQCNHYMVGIIEPFTDDELLAAEQILIARENSTKSVQKRVCSFALDMIEQEKAKRRI